MSEADAEADAENDDAAAIEQLLLHFVETAFFPNPPARVAVAVSGGGDSMALLHLMHRVAKRTGQTLEAVTLDHGLRDASAAEARMAADFCAGIGVPHTTLRWQGWDGQGNLAAAARDARYGLIAHWAQERDIGGVALGHTRDDIAETFVMRLARASGVDGLAAMDARFERHCITWVRPLWQQSRSDLRDYLARHAVPFVDDPTNADPAQERARVRQAMTVLDGLGITTDALHHTAFALRMARSALEYYTFEEAGRHVTMDHGDVLIPERPRLAVPEEINRRLMVAALQCVGGNLHPPRFHSMTSLDAGLLIAGKHTLAGCVVTRKAGTVRITREYQAVRDLACPTTEPWDGRWHLDGPHDPALQIRALGETGLRKIKDWRATGLPRVTLLASPAIWQNDRLIAAPLAGMAENWSASVAKDRKDLVSFLLTH